MGGQMICNIKLFGTIWNVRQLQSLLVTLIADIKGVLLAQDQDTERVV